MPPRRTRVVLSDEDSQYEEGSSNDEHPRRPTRTRRSTAIPAEDIDDSIEQVEEDDAEIDGGEAEEEVEEEEEGEEDVVEEEEDDVPVATEEEESDADADPDASTSTPQKFSIVIKRRGRPRGGGVPRAARGTGRGRPRGRPRGRGRGSLPHGMLVVQKNVAGGGTPRPDAGDDADGTYGEEAAAPTSSGPAPPLPVGTAYRQINGKYYVFEDDELKIEDDEIGDTKIDAQGNLLGGREFKADTFSSPWRPNPEKRYMLSIEAARTSGFRDSLYYFRRNPTVVKLPLSQAEKEHLIGLGRLPTSLKSRSVTIVSARSAFKQHGAKMVKDGRWVTDDYYEDQARKECAEKGNTPGEPVGDLPDLNLYPVGDINQPLRTLEERRAAAAAAAAAAGGGNAQGGGGGASGGSGLALGAGGIYRPGGPTTHFGGQGLGPFDDAHALGGGLGVSSGQAAARRAALSREGVSEENWMWKMALRVHEANEGFASMRRGGKMRAVGMGEPIEGGMDGVLRALRDEDDVGEETEARRKKWLSEGNPMGVYEPHTDLFHYRKDTQPTRAYVEQLMGGPLIAGDKRVGGDAWGVMLVETRLQPPVVDSDDSPAS